MFGIFPYIKDKIIEIQAMGKARENYLQKYPIHLSMYIFLIAAQFELFIYSVLYTECLICYYKYAPTRHSFVYVQTSSNLQETQDLRASSST